VEITLWKGEVTYAAYSKKEERGMARKIDGGTKGRSPKKRHDATKRIIPVGLIPTREKVSFGGDMGKVGGGLERKGAKSFVYRTRGQVWGKGITEV